MAVAISLIVTILENLNGFIRTDENIIKMAKTFNANKLQILAKIVIPANISTFINSLKSKYRTIISRSNIRRIFSIKSRTRIFNSIWRSSI